MIISGFDVETTGLEPGDHRVIEVYIGLWKDGKQVFEYERRVDPQRAIAADAQRVHGISYADLAGKPTFDIIAPDVQKVLAKADVHVAHNASFDIGFLGFELRKAGLALPKRTVIDTFTEAVWATPDGKKPNLKEFCFACGVEYDETRAHAASYDVRVMMDAFHKACTWGYLTIPEVSAVAA